MDKIAIIGTAPGQRGLYVNAKKAGFYTIGFSWDITPELKPYVDKFYQISILEKDKIVELCKIEDVCGVVSNGSELTIQVVSYVAEKLNLLCTPYQTIINIQDKEWVRNVTKDIPGLSQIQYYIYDAKDVRFLPCVIKPTCGCGKAGVSYVSNINEFKDAISYTKDLNKPIIIEEYIDGQEVSVESISYKGNHYVIQITDKDTSGPPHFVELGHHQPSLLSEMLQKKIKDVVPKILKSIGFENGASHTELKIYENKIYLIEVNPRGGGDEISTELVELSTGYNYLLSMILVATGKFQHYPIENQSYSGIYFLMKQTEQLLPFFSSSQDQPWFVKGEIKTSELKESFGNAMKNGFLIYKSDHKIIPNR